MEGLSWRVYEVDSFLPSEVIDTLEELNNALISFEQAGYHYMSKTHVQKDESTQFLPFAFLEKTNKPALTKKTATTTTGAIG